MNNLTRIFLILLALICSLFARADERPPVVSQSKPNFLFIITDDMYPWQMDFMPEGNGKNYTPNLDRLAEEGTLMRRQYITSSVCTPSRYGVLTGRYASRSLAPAFVERLEELGQTHVEWNTFINPTKERSVAHYFDEAGYRTGFVGKDHVAYTPKHKTIFRSADPNDPKIQAAMKRNYAASQEAVRNLGFEYAESIYFTRWNTEGNQRLIGGK